MDPLAPRVARNFFASIGRQKYEKLYIYIEPKNRYKRAHGEERQIEWWVVGTSVHRDDVKTIFDQRDQAIVWAENHTDDVHILNEIDEDGGD
jgi:hypothetical protein